MLIPRTVNAVQLCIHGVCNALTLHSSCICTQSEPDVRLTAQGARIGRGCHKGQCEEATAPGGQPSEGPGGKGTSLCAEKRKGRNRIHVFTHPQNQEKEELAQICDDLMKELGNRN